MFTREIEKELLVRRIDVAVHSAKDLPSERLEELEVVATLPRANTEDVLVTKTGRRLAAWRNRRDGQRAAATSIAPWRPDLTIVDLRGNVPTRLRKLQENETWSGIILARAGLDRLGLEVPMEILSPDDFVPAGGQGIIALQIRRGRRGARQLLEAINDERHAPGVARGDGNFCGCSTAIAIRRWACRRR